MLEKVRSGYKDTEVGEIPEDWDCAELDDFISFISYGFTNPMPTTQNGPHMVTAADIFEGRIDFSTARRTSIEAFETLLTPKSKPRRDDILLTKDGALGRVALVGDETICINQSVAILRPNSRVDPEFLSLLLQAEQYQKRMIEDAGGSTIKHIYITIVNRMPIAVPRSKHEQRAIAKVLGDANARVAALEALIAKKRDLKQAAMQQLLTGKTRLPGFSGKWEEKTLGELSKIQRGASPRPIDSPIWFDESSYVGWVRISDVGKSNMFLTETRQRLSPLGIARSRMVESGSLIMSIAATVGRPVITQIPTCIHDGFVVLSDPECDQEFLYYVLRDLEPKWSKLGQTGSQMNLNTTMIQNATAKFPPTLDEQKAIAKTLSDMDEEITALEAEAEKARAIKQGMMQTLLTGKVRLV